MMDFVAARLSVSLTQVTEALASFAGVSSGASLRFKNFKQFKFDDY